MQHMTMKKGTLFVLFLAFQYQALALDFEEATTTFEMEYQYQQQAYPVQQQNDIRAIRLREWQEAQRNQSTEQLQSYSEPRNINPAPEAEDLFAAAMNGNNAQIGKLLARGLDINISNRERETALHMAAARGHYSTVIYLVNNGAYVNAKTIKHWIPLHHAVRFRHANIVNYLIQRGSSPAARTSDGLSAIDMARNINDYRMLSIMGAR